MSHIKFNFFCLAKIGLKTFYLNAEVVSIFHDKLLIGIITYREGVFKSNPIISTFISK